MKIRMPGTGCPESKRLYVNTRTPPGDEELFLNVRDGDLSAFEEIVRRYQRSAWNTAYRFLNNHEEAEEIVQDTFLRIFDAAPRYRPTASFRTYFFSVLTRLCLNSVRKHKPEAEVPAEATDPAPDAAEQLMSAERRRAVRAAIGELPTTQRMAVVLRYYEGMGYSEIAAALLITEKAAERLLARGRDALRATLPEWLEK